MKVSEIRNKSDHELKEELNELLSEQFKLRMQYGSGQLTQTHQFSRVRRDIARVKTVMNERRKAGEAQ